MDNAEKYIENLNKNVLPHIDYTRLQASYATAGKEYAKEVLKQLHDEFVTVYETDYIDEDSGEFVTVPAIIQGRKTGEICIGLVDLDLLSSGEHYGTDLLTKYGVCEQCNPDAPKEVNDFISEHYMSYNYWYTVEIEHDIHVDMDDMPQEVMDLHNSCSGDDFEMKME